MFSRDGSFLKEAVDGGAYLVDRNGYFLQGWAVARDGEVNTSSLTAIQVPETTVADGVATTEVTLSANIPAGAGSPQTMAVGIYDGDFTERNLSMTWTPAGVNAWSVSCTVDGGTVTPPAIDVAFDGQGKIVSPLASDLAVAWDAGGTSTIALDLSATTQFAGNLTFSSEQDGLPSGTLLSTAFNGSGTWWANSATGARFRCSNCRWHGFGRRTLWRRERGTCSPRRSPPGTTSSSPPPVIRRLRPLPWNHPTST